MTPKYSREKKKVTVFLSFDLNRQTRTLFVNNGNVCYLNHSCSWYAKSVATKIYIKNNKSLQRTSGKRAHSKAGKKLPIKMSSFLIHFPSQTCQGIRQQPILNKAFTCPSPCRKGEEHSTTSAFCVLSFINFQKNGYIQNLDTQFTSVNEQLNWVLSVAS